MLFLNDKYYQHIYGVEDLGAQLSKWENEFFSDYIKRAGGDSLFFDCCGLQQAIKK